MTTYIDLHILQLVPPSCINRDDTGSPKSARFGGVERHRVSSQAWKRAVRQDFATYLDASELGERTKYASARVAERLRQRRPELSEEEALNAANNVLTAAEIKTDLEKGSSYLLFLSRQELEKLADLAELMHDRMKPEDVKVKLSKARAQKLMKKTEARSFLLETCPFDIALFGRMLADVPERNIDAACQVEHALSVHRAIPEFDYFTAVDDNAPEDNAGAGMIGTVEFVSSTLYRYATINVDRLVSNLGNVEAAARAAEAFIQSFVTSMPTGKQNAFANRTRPDFVLLEVRSDQPVSLVNAFEDPVDNDGHALEKAASRLVAYAADGDAVYGTKPVSSAYLAARIEVDSETEAMLTTRGSAAVNLQTLTEQAGAAVRESSATQETR